jgi:hypothetical protein
MLTYKERTGEIFEIRIKKSNGKVFIKHKEESQ